MCIILAQSPQDSSTPTVLSYIVRHNFTCSGAGKVEEVTDSSIRLPGDLHRGTYGVRVAARNGVGEGEEAELILIGNIKHTT